MIRAEPAAIWRRAGAWLIDGAILSAATVAYAAYARAHMSHLPPATQTTGLDWLANRIDSYSGLWIHAAVFAAAAGLLFTVLFHHFGGRTPGKWALRICLVDGSGCRPTFAVCVWRGLVSVVAAGALGLGYFLALFVRRHRGLQDLLSKTYVVRILPS